MIRANVKPGGEMGTKVGSQPVQRERINKRGQFSISGGG